MAGRCKRDLAGLEKRDDGRLPGAWRRQCEKDRTVARWCATRAQPNGGRGRTKAVGGITGSDRKAIEPVDDYLTSAELFNSQHFFTSPVPSLLVSSACPA